jgi:hypothetical protein
MWKACSMTPCGADRAGCSVLTQWIKKGTENHPGSQSVSAQVAGTPGTIYVTASSYALPTTRKPKLASDWTLKRSQALTLVNPCVTESTSRSRELVLTQHFSLSKTGGNEVRIPEFTADASLGRPEKHYRPGKGADSIDGSRLLDQGVVPASQLCDWFPWLPWCPSKPPGVECRHTNTETYCTAFVEWCKDNSICSDGTTRSSGWYACGACIGWG